jgi:hypothetical protein
MQIETVEAVENIEAGLARSVFIWRICGSR